VAPYFCPKCRSNHTLVVPIETIGPTGQAPPGSCPSCGAAMIFDELEEYFNFCRHKG
jgi:hypothetical protein